MDMRMKTKLFLEPGARLEKATKGSSGYDLYWSNDIGSERMLDPGEGVLLNTGVYLEMEEGYEAQVRPRSGLTTKGLVVMLGTIDSDYRGQIKVNMKNLSNSPKLIQVTENSKAIAQLVFSKVEHPAFTVVSNKESLSESERGSQGFGSTDRGGHNGSKRD